MSAYVGRLFTTLSSAFTDFNTATLSGAIDILVIEDDHGRRHCTPFHVRFGKLQLLKARGIPVNIQLNGHNTNLRMFLGAAGEAYFFNPDAVVTNASIDYNIHTPEHIPLKDPTHLQSSFDLPTKAATQQLPNPSQIFASPSDAQPSVPSDFGPSCSAVAIVPSDVASSDPVPADRHFEYCSDSDVELTRAERDGTAQVAQTTHSSPPASASDRKWNTAVAVSFSQFHLEHSLPNVDQTSQPEPQPAEEFSEALFDLPATPPPKPSRPRTKAASETPSRRGVPSKSSPQATLLSFEIRDSSSSNPQTVKHHGRDGAPSDKAHCVANNHQPEPSAHQAPITTEASSNASETHVDIFSAQSNSSINASEDGKPSASQQPLVAQVVDNDLSMTSTPAKLDTYSESFPARTCLYDEHCDSVNPSFVEGDSPRTPSATSDNASTSCEQYGETCASHATDCNSTSPERNSDAPVPRPLPLSAHQTDLLCSEPKEIDGFITPGADTVKENRTRPDQDVRPEQSSSDEEEEHSKCERKLNGKIKAIQERAESSPVQEQDKAETEFDRGPTFKIARADSNELTSKDEGSSQSQLEPNGNFSVTEFQSIGENSIEQYQQGGDDGEQHLDVTDSLVPMSLCGNLVSESMSIDQSLSIFDEHRIPYEDFIRNPEILYDPSVMFRIGLRLVNFKIAAPYVFSTASFKKGLDLDNLKKSINHDENSGDTPPKPPPPTPARRFRWFSWSNAVDESNPDECKDGEEQPIPVVDEVDVGENVSEKDVNAVDGFMLDAPVSVEDGMPDETVQHVIESNKETSASEEDVIVQSQTVSETKNPGDSPDSNESPSISNMNIPGLVSFSDIDPSALSLRPSSEQLMQLELKPGPNTIRFIVESSSVELNCRIFLWSCHTKIVISDVDGTITRSDVLGHLLPAVGRDWSQVGVAGLYSQIEKNGYKILYLTARPIGQASQTRTFLHNVTQGSAKLPNGPVLMSPNRLVESFAREVIRRRPHEFKIAALREVRSLFSPDYNPFHAGFGNRETDVISYRAVGLIPQRIFVVNTRGELAVMKARFESTASYSSLQDLVENVFPDISGRTGFEMIRAITDTATFNDWKWWKGPLPEVDFDALLS